jgi:hypothetical protein
MSLCGGACVVCECVSCGVCVCVSWCVCVCVCACGALGNRWKGLGQIIGRQWVERAQEIEQGALAAVALAQERHRGVLRAARQRKVGLLPPIRHHLTLETRSPEEVSAPGHRHEVERVARRGGGTGGAWTGRWARRRWTRAFHRAGSLARAAHWRHTSAHDDATWCPSPKATSTPCTTSVPQSP